MARSYKQGLFRPQKPEKYHGDVNNIVFRSGWELEFLKWCDKDPSVIKYMSEELVIPYWSSCENKARRYFVDFVIKLKKADGTTQTLIIEIKPHAERFPPVPGKRKTKAYLQAWKTYQVNQDKWAAAEEYAQRQGVQFVVLDEYDLGIKIRRTLKQ